MSDRASTHAIGQLQKFKDSPIEADRDTYLETLYAVDWYLCCGCLERQSAAWD